MTTAHPERLPLERSVRALWPLARRRLWEPRNVLLHWRLRRRYDLRLLGLHDLRVVVPHGVVPDCDTCTNVCCTGRLCVVPLRLVDIARLVDRGLDAHITHARPTYTLVELDQNPALRRLAQSDHFRWFPVMAQDSTSTCTLLGEDLRCRAFPAWPMACARFPYSLDLTYRTVFYARSCGARHMLPAHEAPPAVQRLVLATLDAYNALVRDLVVVHLARVELEALGMTRYLRLGA